jgi:hypothetical protein
MLSAVRALLTIAQFESTFDSEVDVSLDLSLRAQVADAPDGVMW